MWLAGAAARQWLEQGVRQWVYSLYSPCTRQGVVNTDTPTHTSTKGNCFLQANKASDSIQQWLSR